MPSAKVRSIAAGSPGLKAGHARLTTGSSFMLVAATVVALVYGAAPRAGAQGSPAATLRVVQNGGGAVKVEGPRQDPGAEPCDQGFYPNDVNKCVYNGFRQGETVTLTAAATAPAEFKGWSDERCSSPTPTTCTLTLADEQTVVALFSPQPVVVNPAGIDGTETVTITDGAGAPCEAVKNGIQRAYPCSFPLSSELTLVATGKRPQWNPGDCEVVPAADPSSSTCTVTLIGDQRANVGFNGEPPPAIAPPRVEVIFRARKTGNGSGTIRGALDCGSRCSVRVPFGQRVTLVADAAGGSRFVRWTGGCGTAPTCRLQASSTAVAAEFAPSRASFSARVGEITATGRGRRRAIRIAVLVNAPASMRASLVTGRRQAATRVFSLATGLSQLRFRLPRTRAGSYRLKLTIRDRAGTATVRLARTVRLRR